MDVRYVMIVCLLAMWICFVWMLTKTAEQRLLLKEKDVYISDLEKDADIKRAVINEMIHDLKRGNCENKISKNANCVSNASKPDVDDLFEIEILDDVEFNERCAEIDG